MNELLKFIVDRCDFLYNKLAFRFTDSFVSDSFNNAYVKLQKDFLKLRIINERDVISIEIQSDFDSSRQWFDLDLIERFTRDKMGRGSSVENDQGISFLKDNFDIITTSFSSNKIEETVSEIDNIRSKRAKEMFKKVK